MPARLYVAAAVATALMSTPTAADPECFTDTCQLPAGASERSMPEAADPIAAPMPARDPSDIIQEMRARAPEAPIPPVVEKSVEKPVLTQAPAVQTSPPVQPAVAAKPIPETPLAQAPLRIETPAMDVLPPAMPAAERDEAPPPACVRRWWSIPRRGCGCRRRRAIRWMQRRARRSPKSRSPMSRCAPRRCVRRSVRLSRLRSKPAPASCACRGRARLNVKLNIDPSSIARSSGSRSSVPVTSNGVRSNPAACHRRASSSTTGRSRVRSNIARRSRPSRQSSSRRRRPGTS